MGLLQTHFDAVEGFLVESVAATIEVKSLLTQEALGAAVRAAHAVKNLKPHLVHSIQAGYQPPAVQSYVVAYDGPTSMKTVYSWLGPIHAGEGITLPDLPVEDAKRWAVPSASVDGIFVLGRGFVIFDNTRLSFVPSNLRQGRPGIRWSFSDVERGSLLMLFALLTVSTTGIRGSWLDPLPYLADFKMPMVSVGA